MDLTKISGLDDIFKLAEDDGLGLDVHDVVFVDEIEDLTNISNFFNFYNKLKEADFSLVATITYTLPDEATGEQSEIETDAITRKDTALTRTIKERGGTPLGTYIRPLTPESFYEVLQKSGIGPY